MDGKFSVETEMMDASKVAILCIQLIAIVARVFTFMVFWSWYAVDRWGLPSIRWYHALLLLLLLTVLTTFKPFGVNDDRTNTEVWAGFLTTAMGRILGCVVILLLGLIVQGLG